MKIENRLVYIADDGLEFDGEEACKQYERSVKLSDYLAELIYENTPDLSRSESQDAAEVISENIIKILAVYNNL